MNLFQIDARVTRLEQEMPEIRDLAAAASKEVGDVHARLRAHTTSLQALRVTQVEHTQQLVELNKRIVDTGFEMREGFVKVYERIAGVHKEARDGFAKVEQEFAKVEQEFANVRGEIANVRGEMHGEFANVRGEMQEGFAKIAALIQDRAKPGEP
ncbi:hypothetical protein [Actinophytocola sp.]|uniref:hypothetical protein n=1 Tax=Actinophytocola sp. TaxID=1872138 RepID=UPI002D80EF06|nr:hypothetical protein [Actinophytocola sp.]HET9143728.1 hypothetical protein [Actinophytocola sp.]